jgi:hypothetical protein
MKDDEIGFPTKNVRSISELVRERPRAHALRRVLRKVTIVESQHVERIELGEVGCGARRVDGEERPPIREGALQK